MTVSTVLRRLAVVVAVVVGLEALYLLGVNALLASGFIQREASVQPEQFQLSWEKAFSPWPGRVHVTGVSLRVQDPVLELHVVVPEATVQISLWALLQKTFRATHVEASGVRFHFLMKADGDAAGRRRAAAFAPMEGFEAPALLADPMPAPLTPEQIAALWGVQLEDVSASIEECWFLEYRYLGAGHVSGGFTLSPLRTLSVSDAVMQLEGGSLTVGAQRLAKTMTADMHASMPLLELPDAAAFRIFHFLTASVRVDAALGGLGFANLYAPGLRAYGSGTFLADLQVEAGVLQPSSSVELFIPWSKVEFFDYVFEGPLHASMGPTPDEPGRATFRAALNGTALFPIAKGVWLTAALRDVEAAADLGGRDLAISPHFTSATLELGSVMVADARGLTHLMERVVPVFAPAVLGTGPLTASATLFVDGRVVKATVPRLRLGDAELGGTATHDTDGWHGVAAGHFGFVPVGLELRANELKAELFVPPDWLTRRLQPGVAVAD